MDKFNFQFGGYVCSGFDAAGLEQMKEASCAGDNSQYQLGAWLIGGAFASFVIPAMARSLRDFFRTSVPKERGEKE